MTRKEILALDDVSLDRAVKIQGTQYDRKRKLNDKQVAKASKMLNNKNMTAEEVAEYFGIDKRTVRYYFDEEYRKTRIEQCTGVHVRRSAEADNEAFLDRVAYKRKLVARNRLSV